MKILLLSNFGALFPAEYIYKYLVKAGHQVVSVGRIFKTDMPEFKHSIERLGSTHMPLFWREETNRNGMPVWTVDLSTIFAMLGDDWDVILECECFNLHVSDDYDLIDKIFDIPYFLYKTQYLEDYMPGHVTHIFYAADLIKDKLLNTKSPMSDWNYEYHDNISREYTMTYLPLTVDPEIVVSKNKKANQYAFFAGNYPEGDFLPEFKDVYKMRGDVIDHLEMNLNGKFICFKRRAFDYMEYIRRASESLIMINAGIGGLNIRDFEAIALGKALITWDNPEYAKNHLVSGKDYIHYTTIQEALIAAQHLLDHPEEAEIIGRNAKKIFDMYHHPENRIKVIIEAIKNAK